MTTSKESLFFSNVRSVRMLFVFPPEQVLTALAESAALWGGMYNPIVADVRLIGRALDLYRPEYVVCVAAERERIAQMNLLPAHYLRTYEQEFQKDEGPRLSIGMSGVTEDIFEAEFKFARQFEVQRRLPIAPETSMKAYWIARLGAFADPALSSRSVAFRQAYTTFLQPEELRPDAYVPFNDSRQLSPMFLTTYHLHVGAAPTSLVLLDPQNVEHVLCYWNIRALGWRTIALAFSHLAEATSETIDEYPVTAAQRVVVLGPASKDQLDHVRRIVGRAVPVFEIAPEHFFEQFDPRDLYPPATPDHLREQSTQVNATFTLQLQAPAFLMGPRSRLRISGATWVNTVRRALGPPWLMNSFRDLTLHDSRLFGTMQDVNPLTNELAIIGSGDSKTAYVRWPSSFEYVAARLSKHRMTVTRAPLSKVLDAALEVHGLQDLRLLAHPEVARLWLRSSGGDYLERWRDTCRSATERREEIADRWLSRMVECGLLVRGAFIKCSSCLQLGWVSVEAIGLEFPCAMCSRQSQFPSIPTREFFRLAYRRSGPLAQSSHARSCVSIALTMRYLSEMWDRATWTGPVYLNRDGRQVEVDGVCEFPTMVIGQMRWVFVEAKTENQLEPVDFERMKMLADMLPGCACIVATLRDGYSEPERQALRELAQYLKERHCLLVPLTAHELLNRSEWTMEFPPHSMEEAAGKMSRYLT